MDGSILIEILKSIGRLFINPLLYVALLSAIFLGYKRVKRERRFFNTRILGGWSELKNMSYDDAMKQAMNAAGADPDKMNSARNAVNAVYYGVGGKGKGMAPGVMIGIEDMLRNGEFKSKEEFAEFISDPVTFLRKGWLV